MPYLYGCISFDSYIKPQLVEPLRRPKKVVYLLDVYKRQAIESDGVVKYVKRINFASMKENDVKNIVDDTVRGIIAVSYTHLEMYPRVQRTNNHGVYQLGSPRIDSVRNTMAMRSMFRLRKLVNRLLEMCIRDRVNPFS